MNVTPTQRLTIDAAIDSAVIRGTLTAPGGSRRHFHGWLELTTALQAMLDTGGVVGAFEAKPLRTGPGAA